LLFGTYQTFDGAHRCAVDCMDSAQLTSSDGATDRMAPSSWTQLDLRKKYGLKGPQIDHYDRRPRPSLESLKKDS